MLASRVEIVQGDPMKTIAAYEQSDTILRRHMENAAERCADVVAAEWSRIAPKRTGHYAASVVTHVEPLGDLVVGVAENVASYADYLERGTGLYRVGPGTRGKIRPRIGKAMFWEENGRRVFARSVRGQRPQWIARRARIASRHRFGPIHRIAAYEAAREIKARL